MPDDPTPAPLLVFAVSGVPPDSARPRQVACLYSGDGLERELLALAAMQFDRVRVEVATRDADDKPPRFVTRLRGKSWEKCYAADGFEQVRGGEKGEG